MKEAARMKRLPITDAQVDLVAERLRAVGVGRREFLKVAAGLAAMGSAGFNVRPVAAAPKLAPGETLAKDQTFRYGGGGWWQDDPTSQDFNKDLYCNGVPALFAGLMKFNADHQAVLYVASKVSPNQDGSQWIFNIRKDAKWSDGSPCTAHTSSTRGNASSTPPRRRLTPRSSTTSRTPRRSTRRRSRTQARSAYAPRTTGRSRWRSRGPAATSRSSRRTWRPYRRTAPPSSGTATSGPRPPTSSAMGPSYWRAGSTARLWCCGRTNTSSAPRTSSSTRS